MSMRCNTRSRNVALSGWLGTVDVSRSRGSSAFRLDSVRSSDWMRSASAGRTKAGSISNIACTDALHRVELDDKLDTWQPSRPGVIKQRQRLMSSHRGCLCCLSVRGGMQEAQLEC